MTFRGSRPPRSSGSDDRSLSITVYRHQLPPIGKPLSPAIAIDQKKSSLSVQKTIRQQSVSIKIPATCRMSATKSPVKAIVFTHHRASCALDLREAAFSRRSWPNGRWVTVRLFNLLLFQLQR